jgi:Tol biopolymer transport system component
MNILIRCLYLTILCSVAACSPGVSQTSPPVTEGINVIPTDSAGDPYPEPLSSDSGYGLPGRLLLIEFAQTGNRLVELNLESGERKTVFQAPENSWLSAAVVSPDNQQILLAYAPPPPGDEIQYGYTELYLMEYSISSQPELLVSRVVREDSYFLPTWTPDGRSIYYTRLRRIDPSSEVPTYQYDIELTNLEGETMTILENALWPQISPDGSRLSYLSANPFTFSNDLYLASPDGASAVPVFPPGANPPIDAHIFSMDGNQLIFSMVNIETAPASSWLEELIGVRTVSAHSVPSDWYMTPVSGGTPQRLTNLNDVNLIGSLSPDGTKLAFISASGLYVMNIDGSGLAQLSSDLLVGTVDWIE